MGPPGPHCFAVCEWAGPGSPSIALRGVATPLTGRCSGNVGSNYSTKSVREKSCVCTLKMSSV